MLFWKSAFDLLHTANLGCLQYEEQQGQGKSHNQEELN